MSVQPFVPGQTAYIVNHANLRCSPGHLNKTQSDRVATLPPGSAATIHDGPFYLNGLVWWSVANAGGHHGYIAESDPHDTPILAAITAADLHAHITTQAAAHNLPAHVAQAVFAVEAGPLAQPAARMAVRLEVHVLCDHVANLPAWIRHFRYGSAAKPHEGHQWRPHVDDAFRPLHEGQTQERTAIEFASRIFPREAVLRAVSMGCGQIMGYHHRAVGFATATEMAAAWQYDYAAQVTGFFRFIAEKDLIDYLRVGAWRKFAAAYNGAGNIEVYGARLQAEVGSRE